MDVYFINFHQWIESLFFSFVGGKLSLINIQIIDFDGKIGFWKENKLRIGFLECIFVSKQLEKLGKMGMRRILLQNTSKSLFQRIDQSIKCEIIFWSLRSKGVDDDGFNWSPELATPAFTAWLTMAKINHQVSSTDRVSDRARAGAPFKKN